MDQKGLKGLENRFKPFKPLSLFCEKGLEKKFKLFKSFGPLGKSWGAKTKILLCYFNLIHTTLGKVMLWRPTPVHVGFGKDSHLSMLSYRRNRPQHQSSEGLGPILRISDETFHLPNRFIKSNIPWYLTCWLSVLATIIWDWFIKNWSFWWKNIEKMKKYLLLYRKYLL